MKELERDAVKKDKLRDDYGSLKKVQVEGSICISLKMRHQGI